MRSCHLVVNLPQCAFWRFHAVWESKNANPNRFTLFCQIKCCVLQFTNIIISAFSCCMGRSKTKITIDSVMCQMRSSNLSVQLGFLETRVSPWKISFVFTWQHWFLLYCMCFKLSEYQPHLWHPSSFKGQALIHTVREGEDYSASRVVCYVSSQVYVSACVYLCQKACLTR